MIYISYAHHPRRPGACFMNESGQSVFCEHAESVVWSHALHELLPDSVVVTAGGLADKVAMINARAGAQDLALEIHFNSAVNSHGVHVGRGSETLYCPGSERGERAAAVMQHHLSQVMGPDRGIAEGWYQMNPAKGPDYFLEKTRCVALIVEPEFVHRYSLIHDNRDVAVKAMARSILHIQAEVLHGA